jgi:hypothetical protein
MDRAEDGSSITFSAKYDYITDSVTDVVLNDKSLRGNFTIDDLIRVATTSEEDIKIKHAPEVDTVDFANLLDLDDSDEALRSQVIAQDLAIQLLVKELEQFNILVATTQQIIVINPATLTEFKITDIFIEDPNQKRQVQISFEYNSLTKMISNIDLEEGVPVTFSSQINVKDFISTVFSSLYGKEQEIAAVNAAISELDKLGLILKENDFRFTDTSQSQIDFNTISLKTMPIDLKGIYDRNSKSFIKVEHEFLTSSNILIDSYLPKVAELWVIDYLANKGIAITKDNISSILPNDKINIKDYKRGDKVLNFIFDVSSNRLLDIKLEGVSTKVDSMTFEEFSLIKGAKATSEKEPVEKVIEEVDPLTRLIGTCGDFADKLATCTKYSCEFEHPYSGESMVRRISGLISDKCRYIEEMPENQQMQCNYTDSLRAAVSEYHKDLLGVGIVVTSVTLGEGALVKTYTVDGQEVTNPAQHALTIGECVVLDGGSGPSIPSS